MKDIEFCERINQLIERYSKGNQTEFAQMVGIAQATLQRNLQQKRGDLLKKKAALILQALPEVSREWLLSGVGSATQEGVHKTQNEVILQEKVKFLEEQLKDAHVEILRLKDELLTVYRSRQSETLPMRRDAPDSAPGTPSAAPLSRQETE